MRKWIVVLLLCLIPEILFASVYTTEDVDGDGYYAHTLDGAAGKTGFNFGGCTAIPLRNHTETLNNSYTIGTFGWTSIASAGNGVVVACTMFVQISAVSVGGNVASHVQMKPYIVGTNCGSAANGTSSWAEWYQHSTGSLDTLFTTISTPSTSWGNTGSTFNRSDASGNDKTASMSTVNVTGIGVLAWAIDTTYVNQFVRGNIPQLTVLLIPAASTEVTATAIDEIDVNPYTPVLHIWWADVPAAVSKGTRWNGGGVPGNEGRYGYPR